MYLFIFSRIVHAHGVSVAEFRCQRRRDGFEKGHERLWLRPKSHYRHNRQPWHCAANRNRGGLQNVIRKGKKKKKL